MNIPIVNTLLITNITPFVRDLDFRDLEFRLKIYPDNSFLFHARKKDPWFVSPAS